MPTYSEYVLAKADQSLPVPGTKLVDLIDPSTGLVTKTPVSNIGGGNPVVQTLTDGATITMNVLNGKWARVTIGGNRTFAFSNLAIGDAGLIDIKQDGTGGRTITWPAGAVIPSGGLALSAGANELTTIGYVWDGVILKLSKENYGVLAADTTPPSVVSMRVEDATPNRIDILYDETLLTTPLPANGDFAATGKTVTGIAIVGSTVRVTVSVAFANGDTASIGYTPGTNKVKDAAGNDAPAITLSTGNVTNAVGGSVDYLNWTILSASHEQITSNQGVRKITGAGNAFGTTSNISVSTETIAAGERVIWKVGAGANKSLGYLVGLGASTATLMDSAPGLDFAAFIGYNLVVESKAWDDGANVGNILTGFADDSYFCIFYDGATIKYQTSTDAITWTTQYTSANTPSGTYNVQFQPYSELGGPIQIWKA